MTDTKSEMMGQAPELKVSPGISKYELLFLRKKNSIHFLQGVIELTKDYMAYYM